MCLGCGTPESAGVDYNPSLNGLELKRPNTEPRVTTKRKKESLGETMTYFDAFVYSLIDPQNKRRVPVNGHCVS